MDLIQEIVELNDIKAKEIIEEKLSKNEDPLSIMNDIKIAMKKIGDKFQNKEYFLPDLIMSGEILSEAFKILAPHLKKGTNLEEKKGKVLLGTVAGDIHDIGKDVVKFMLDVNGFEVLDLGVDVPAEKFIQNMKEFKPHIVALSGFLTLAFDSMKNIIQKIKDEGLRDNVKIMIGGGTLDQTIVEYVDADAYGESAVEAVDLASKWMEV